MKPRFTHLILLALAYAVLGLLGLALAVPPGFASPLYPAAGLALAAALVMGRPALLAVGIGSFLANLIQMQIQHLPIDVRGLLVGAGIAFGAWLQALVAESMIRRLMGARWRRLDSEREIVQFLLVGGPLACLVSATVGCATLTSSGVIQAVDFLSAWWNWWLGDSLGVTVAAPLCLLVFLAHEPLWKARRVQLASVMLSILLIVGATFLMLSRWESAETRRKLAEEGTRITGVLQTRIDAHEEAISALRRLIEVSPNLSFAEFDHFTRITLSDHSDISALSFNPVVQHAQRQAFEARMSRALAPKKVLITQRDPERGFEPAVERAFYVPVGYISPLDANWAAVGYDVHSEAMRRDTLSRAMQTHAPAVTSVIQLVQDQRKHPGVLIFHPAYRSQRTEASGSDSINDLIGFAVGVIKIDEFYDQANWSHSSSDLQFRLEEKGGNQGTRVIFETPMSKSAYPDFTWFGRLTVADREWAVSIIPSREYIHVQRSVLAWAIGIAGLLLASLLQAFMLAATGRTNLIEAKVSEQTQVLKQQSETLEEILDEHRHLIERIPVGVFKLSAFPDGLLKFRFVSQLWCEQLGVSEDAVMADGGVAVRQLPFEARAYFLSSFWPTASEPRLFEWSGPISLPGETRWLSVRAMPTRADAGEILWEGIQSDITRLKQAEFQQHLLSTAVAQSRSSVVITNVQGEIVFVNEAFERQTGYRQSEVIGKNPRLWKSGQTDQQTYQSLWSTIISGRTWSGELLNKNKQGELYWEQVTISPVRNEKHKITHFLSIKDNISERRAQQLELKKAKDDAEAANLAKSQFLATMSHEIRTPMNGILGMAQLLGAESLNDDDRRQFAGIILSSGHTLLTLLNDILDLSKIEAGRLELHPAPTDPAGLLNDIATLFSQPATAKALKVNAAWHGPANVSYSLDEIRIRQMLSNLISNAIKFTNTGYIHIDGNELSRTEGGVKLVFSVTDSGIGIDPEDLPKLFKTFSQVDGSATRQFAGTGLGLSIVAKMASAMGGEVGVDSQPGQGSRFWFTVSTSLQTPLASALPKDQAIPQDKLAAQQKDLVLIVEDDRVNADVVARMLSSLNLDSFCARNGQEAVDYVCSGKPCRLILMDCQMPVMDGFAATEKIREWEGDFASRRTPIIAVTANAFESDKERCFESGMDDFMAKPIHFDNFTQVIRHWLEESNAMPEKLANAHAYRFATVLDTGRINTALADLKGLIENNKFDAIHTFRTLRELLGEHSLSSEVEAIEHMLAAFNFTAAGKALAALCEQQGWTY